VMYAIVNILLINPISNSCFLVLSNTRIPETVALKFVKLMDIPNYVNILLWFFNVLT
jgi:hypothetical protein